MAVLSLTVVATLFFLSCSISTSFTVLLYFIFKKELHRRSSRLMFSMAIADLVGASFWFADIMHSLCPLTMIINLYGYQAAQAWSCVIGAYLILKFTDSKMPPEILFHLIAWGIPFIPQGIILSKKLYAEHPPPQGCWLEFGQAEMLVVAIPQVVSVLLNATFLGVICTRRSGKKTGRWGFRNRDKSLFLIQICCLVASIASVLQSIPDAPSVVYDVSFILGASQGLFNTLSMRQRMVLRFFSWTNSKLFTTKPIIAPNFTVTIDNNAPSPPNDHANVPPVAPSSVNFLVKPFGTYHSIRSSDIN